MRLLHIHFGKDGGAEKFFVKLANGLARRGVSQKVIIRPNRIWRKDFHENVDVFAESHFRSLSVGRWILPLKLNQLLKSWQPDAIIGWMSRAGHLIPRQSFCPRFVRLGDFQDTLHQFKYVDTLICNTPGVESHVRKVGWNRDTVVISNFTPTEAVAPVSRAEVNTPDHVPLLCAIGRMVPRKGFDIVIRALQLIPDAHLWLVGDGEERKNLENLAEKLGVMGRVKFIGWLNDARPYVAASDVSVMASRHEPLGNVILESWAQRTPVVSTKSEGPSWLVQDRVNGLLVEIDDHSGMATAVQQVLNDKSLSRKLVDGGVASLEADFSEDAVVGHYIRLIESAKTQCRVA